MTTLYLRAAVRAYRRALDSLSSHPSSEAALLLAQLDRRFPEFACSATNKNTQRKKSNATSKTVGVT